MSQGEGKGGGGGEEGGGDTNALKGENACSSGQRRGAVFAGLQNAGGQNKISSAPSSCSAFPRRRCRRHRRCRCSSRLDLYTLLGRPPPPLLLLLLPPSPEAETQVRAGALLTASSPRAAAAAAAAEGR